MYAFQPNSKKRQRTWQSRYDRLIHHTRDLEHLVLDLEGQVLDRERENVKFHKAPEWLKRLFFFVLKLIER